jgi:hypothetical protein
MKVFVLGDEHALMIARQLPDSLIRRTAGAKRSKVKGVRDDIVQQRDELLGELFIEEQAHRSSGGNRVRSALAFRSVSETRPHILARQLRKIQEDLILRHPFGEVTEHVANADARATDAGLPKPDLWIDADPIEQAHAEATMLPSGRNRSALGSWQLESTSERTPRTIIVSGCRRDT